MTILATLGIWGPDMLSLLAGARDVKTALLFGGPLLFGHQPYTAHSDPGLRKSVPDLGFAVRVTPMARWFNTWWLANIHPADPSYPYGR